MHLAYFTSTTGEPTEYSLVYLSAPGGDPNDLVGEEILFSGIQALEHPTIQCAELSGDPCPTVLLAGETGEAVIKWWNPFTGSWTDPIQVDLNSKAVTPSMWIDPDTLHVHFVWSEPDDEGYMQVWYRRGQFVEL
jgi:hypothetical protein